MPKDSLAQYAKSLINVENLLFNFDNFLACRKGLKSSYETQKATWVILSSGHPIVHLLPI